ncbi:MAG: enoyl-CoA hydratase/isomerase family protein [Planctomycetes bacterium]|nr:enoyl-CoA hydratase/isomerase family protein [Planctomycetota bacterium]
MTPTTIEPFAIDMDSDGIATVKLDQPGRPVVVLDHDLLRRLEATLAALPRGIRGFILASASERVFVAGADLKTITEWSDDQLHRYLAFGSEVYLTLATLPCPTVAAINGAALGGGLELPMHCDGMIAARAAKPYPVGLPEAGLCICPGWGGTNLLPMWVKAESIPDAITRTCIGKPYMLDEAIAAGLFDQVVDSAADLIPACKAWLKSRRTSASNSRELWNGHTASRAAAVKALDSIRHELPGTDESRACAAALDIGLTQGYLAALASERDSLVKLRHTPRAKEALANFFAKSAKK